MSQIKTQRMGRILAAGSKEKIDEVLDTLAKLNAIHFIEYDGTDDGFKLGTPKEESEVVGKRLNKLRSAASIVNFSGPKTTISEDIVRSELDNSLNDAVEKLLQKSSQLESITNSLSNAREKKEILDLLSSLEIDIDLLSGYSSLSSFIGTISGSIPQVESEIDNGEIPGIYYHGTSNGIKVVAIFVRNEHSNSVQSSLNQSGFQAINIPENMVGNPSLLLSDLQIKINDLISEEKSTSNEIKDWSDKFGPSLACGLEVLERDHDILTAPVKIAVSNHAFFIDGWIELSRSEEVQNALKNTCLYTEVNPFKVKAGGGGHGHSDEHHHHQEMPPISYQDRKLSKPMELLTDAVGRPAYGRIDPTLFMFVTYPIFFGMMLGDMAYGLVTLALGAYVFSKANSNEMVELGGKFLIYIGLGTLIFGYIYAEFAGWEIFMYEKTKVDGIYTYGENISPVAFLANLYPFDLDHGYGPAVQLGYGINLSFPFHRVGTHLNALIILTIYVGFFHIIIGKLIGFRDVLFYGTDHGHVGVVAAFFEHGVWILLLIGGFFFSYGYLGSTKYGLDVEHLMLPGAIVALSSVVMLIYTLYKYHGIPIAVSLILAPIEAMGMMPSVISYVRLFAVGIVGVKIAETGNKLWEPMMEADAILVPVFFIGWLSVQMFAWALGVFSPNIHAARLHFVEWMRQYYDSSGEAFEPFGFRSNFVEVE